MSQPITFVIYGADAAVTESLRAAVSANRRTHLLASCERSEQMYAETVRLQPAAAVVTVGDDPEQEFSLIRRLAEACPATMLISAVRGGSPEAIRGGMRAGAQEFLCLPAVAGEFEAVLDQAEKFMATRVAARKRGQVIAVFSSKGGGGVSFVAANLAAALGPSTALADLNLQAGDLDTFLGVEPRHSVVDLVNSRKRLDDALVASYMAQYSPQLSLLAAPLEAHDADEIAGEDIFEVIHILRQRYSNVVLDLQHTFDPVTVSGLDQADHVLLLLTLDIPSIRRAKGALKVFERLGYSRQKVHIVVNRWKKQIDDELRKVEMHLGEQILGFIPNDYRPVIESINLGKPLVLSDPSSKVSAEITRIAKLMSAKAGGQPAGASSSAPERKGLFKSIFNRQSAGDAALNLYTTPDKAQG